MKDCLKMETVRGYTGWRVQLTPAPTMRDAERNRLSGLVKGLMGCITLDPPGYLLTPVRAKKCAMLYAAGFEYAPSSMSHFFRRIDLISMCLHDAIAIARKTVSNQS